MVDGYSAPAGALPTFSHDILTDTRMSQRPTDHSLHVDSGGEADLIPLEPRPTRPNLPGTVIVRDGPDTVIDAIAADLMVHAANCVRAFGDFHLALSGGSTPLPLYERLMIDPRYRDLPWSRTHLWIVDERRVGFDDERSNFKHISEILSDHSGIPAEQIHPMFAQSDEADAAYERTLREVLGWRERGQDRLDFVLLGMGADGHTASLFPRSAALMAELNAAAGSADSQRLVRINTGPQVVPPDRVTMTLRLLNASRFIGLMVTGEGKRATLARVRDAIGAGSPDRTATERGAAPKDLASGPAEEGDLRPAPSREATADLPVLGIRPIGGVQRWYLDFAACPEQKPV